MTVSKKSILKPTIQITVLSFVGIILNFVTQLVIAYFFGTTPERDAYFAATVLPTYLTSILVGSIGIMFLPQYVDIKTKKSTQQADDFFSRTLALLTLLTLIVVVLFSVFAENTLSVTTPGFQGEQLALASKLLVILLPTTLLQVVINVISSALQVQRRFIAPALNPIIVAITSLLFVALFCRFWGIESLAYGLLAGNLLVAAILFILARKSAALKWSINFRSEEICKLLKVSVPLLATGIFFRLTGVFERGIASTLPEGSISYLGYANQIMLILATIVTSGIATTIYPLLSTAWSERNFGWLQMLLDKGISAIFLLTLPVSIIFICWGSPIIQLVFERGVFTHESTIAVSSTFSILTIAFIANCLGGVAVKFFYFMRKTVLISCFEVVGTLSYLVIAYFTVRALSYKGLALALSGSALISIVMSFTAVSIMVREIKMGKIGKNLLVALLASVIPAICILIGVKIGDLNVENSFPLLILCLLTYLGGYYLILKMFKVEELQLIHSRISQYLKKQ